MYVGKFNLIRFKSRSDMALSKFYRHIVIDRQSAPFWAVLKHDEHSVIPMAFEFRSVQPQKEQEKRDYRFICITHPTRTYNKKRIFVLCHGGY